MSLFRRDPNYVTYTCPGCANWQLEVPYPAWQGHRDAVNEALTDHRKECPELSAIYARAHARQADKEVPVAPALPTPAAVAEIEAELTELAQTARRNDLRLALYPSATYLATHARIDELLTWRDEALAAAKVQPVVFTE